jgi:hypothetical protein
VRGQDYQIIIKNDLEYNDTLGLLKAAAFSDDDSYSGNYRDSFEDLTFAVFHLKIVERAIAI